MFFGSQLIFSTRKTRRRTQDLISILSRPTGINDYSASKTDGNHLPQAAQVVLDQITLLASPPTNARSFLVTDDYGRGTHNPNGDAYKTKIFQGLAELHSKLPHLQVAFVDFAPLWDAVLGSTPGYKAFGYASSGYCVADSLTTVGACSGERYDPLV